MTKNESIVNVDKMKDSLLTDYLRIKSFLESICDEDYRYVVLLTRRCLILTEMFFKEEIVLKNKKTEFISDYALCTVLEKLEKRDRICIVDDILIHGRKVKQIYDLLEKANVDRSNIDVRVCVKNEEENILDETEINMQYEREACASLWRDSSNRIVQSILQTETPYVSYIGYMDSKTEHDSICEEKLSDFLEYNINILDDFNINFEIAYGKKIPELKLLNQIAYLSCVRKYVYPSGKVTLIPYVFLKSIKLDFIDEFFSYIANILEDNGLTYVSNLFRTCLSETTGNNNSRLYNKLCEYKYNMMTMVISWTYGVLLYGNKQEVERNIQSGIIKYSLTENKYLIMEELNQINSEKAYKILSDSCDNITKMFVDEISLKPEYLDNLSREVDGIYSIIDKKDCKRSWDKFVYKSFCVDEERAENKRERFLGIPVEYLWKGYVNKEAVLESNDTLVNLLGEIIGTWDVGRTSCSSVVDIEGGFIGDFVSPGEQAYRTLIMENIDILQCLYHIIRERMNNETEVEAIQNFCNSLSMETGRLNDYKEKINEVVNIIIHDIDSWRLSTLLRPIKDKILFNEVDNYTTKRREGI